MNGESLYDSQNQLIESFVEVTAPVTFVGPTGLHLFGYDPTLGLVDANGNPITGGGGSPGSPDQSLQFNNAGSFAGNASLVRDATTGGLILNAKSRIFGNDDSADSGDPSLFVTAPSGGDTSIAIAHTYVSGASWSGLSLQADNNQQSTIEAVINGNLSTTSMVIRAGSGGMFFDSIGGGGFTFGADIKVSGAAVTIKSDTTDAHALSLSAYDVDGAAYVPMLTLTNGNTPTVNVTAPSGLQFNSLPIAFGVTATAHNSEPSLFVMKSGGGESAVIVGSAFTSGSNFTGLILSNSGATSTISGTLAGDLNYNNLTISFPSGVITHASYVIGLAATGYIAVGADMIVANGKSIQTDTTDAHVYALQAYDVDGASYKTFLTLQNGNTPVMTIAPPSGGSVSIQATTYKSSDGTTGLASFSGTPVSITVKNGLITAAS